MRKWPVIVAWTCAALAIALFAFIVLAGCAGQAESVKQAPVAAPEVHAGANSSTAITQTQLQEAIQQAINAANSAKTVNGNQITNQGITNAQLGCFLGLGIGVLFILIGVFVDAPSLTTAESVYLEIGGTILVFGTLWLMLGGALPPWPSWL